MKTIFISFAAILFISACGVPHNETVISLTYQQKDIQKQFDTLYNYQQTNGVYNGFIEQALAVCDDTTVTQDVFSSMYYNRNTGVYDCLTTTVFKFSDGTMTATGLFNLTPGDTIAPDHDFPVTGGSAVYSGVSGTYTRRYENGVYYVELRYVEVK